MKLKKIAIFVIIIILIIHTFLLLPPYIVYSQEETTETSFPLPERFTQEKEKLGPGVYFNYSSTTSQWLFWEIITENSNNSYIVVVINQTKTSKETEFLEVPKSDALTYKNYFWTNPDNLVVGQTNIRLANGTADVISEIILRFTDKYKNTLEISAYRLVVTSGEMKGMILICEKDSGVVLQLYEPHNEDTPLLQIQATNLKLANPNEDNNDSSKLSKEDIINMTVTFLAFFMSLLLVYLANKITTPIKKDSNKKGFKMDKNKSSLDSDKSK